MDNEAKILIVEDDMIIAANLSLQLSKLGYKVTGIESRGEEAIAHASANAPDIILMDINLKGRLNGIETVIIIQKVHDIPVIYLTANSDETTFDLARDTQPYAFISKPFNKLDLQHAIALVCERIKYKKAIRENRPSVEILEDRIFVRHKGKMTKLLLNDIHYIEADRNYCTIKSNSSTYVLASTLKTMEDKLPKSNFVRVHRSYMVNISKLDVVGDHHLEINRKVIPLSKSHKKFLMSRIQTI